jgi:hypothetical protein
MKLFVSSLIVILVSVHCAYGIPQDQAIDNKDIVVPNSIVMDSDAATNSNNELDSSKPDVHVFAIPDAGSFNETFTCLEDGANLHIYYLDCVGDVEHDAGYCDLRDCIREPTAPVCFKGKCYQNIQ